MENTALLKQNISQTYPTVTHGRGVYLFDVEGRDYLDGSSGAMTASIGHGVVEIAEVMKEQASRVAFTYRTQFTSEPAERLALKLVALAPGDLNWVSFVNSGSEASELAIRTSVANSRERDRPEKVKILSRHISYHGMTMGSLSLSGHTARRQDYGSLLHPFPVVPPAYAYRYAKDSESEEEYSARAAKEFEDAIIAADPETVAAIIVEPIVGAAGGVLVPPAGYMKRLRDMCDRLDVLMIVDEVITGIGRTGDWFASMHEGIVPDMLLFGKGISGGYAPMAGVIMREHLVQTMREGSQVSPFGHTYSGNPLSSAVCVAVLDLLEREHALENVKNRGEQLERALRSLADEFPFIADVRGRGLLWGFEFVMDQKSKEPPSPEKNSAASFVAECCRQGLIVYPAGIPPLNNAILISPSLLIKSDDMQVLIDRLRCALEQFAQHFMSGLLSEQA